MGRERKKQRGKSGYYRISCVGIFKGNPHQRGEREWVGEGREGRVNRWKRKWIGGRVDRSN